MADVHRLPKVTRLRYAVAKTQQDLVDFLESLGRRVQIYGAPVWDGKRWTLWFVPDDRGQDIQSVDLTKAGL